MSYRHRGGPVFTAPFSATTLTTNAQDLFFVTAPSGARVAIREIRLGQYTEFGDAQAELLSLQILTGTTSTGVGTSITPRNVRQHTNAPTAAATVNAPSTTLCSTASAILRLADSWNVAGGWYYKPDERERIVLNAAQKA